MKLFLVAALSVLVGVGIGYYVARLSGTQNTTEAVDQGIETIESCNAMEAIRDASAIALIGSGENGRAVQVLSKPLTDYYSLYGTNAGTNAQRAKVRILIENLVRTNAIVADEMKKGERAQDSSGEKLKNRHY